MRFRSTLFSIGLLFLPILAEAQVALPGVSGVLKHTEDSNSKHYMRPLPFVDPCLVCQAGSCPGGMACINGCCKELVCLDSDGGDDPFTYGHVVILAEDEPFPNPPVYPDRCNGDTLTEFFCGPDNLERSVEHQCVYGCDAGACREQDLGTPVSGCAVIDQPGDYYLVQSLINEMPIAGSRGCIDISADNVVFDCDSNSITDSAHSATGVYSSGDNTVVRNCDVRMSAYSNPEVGPTEGGIGMEIYGDGSLVEDNLLTENSLFGLKVGGDATIIRNNFVIDNHPGQYMDGIGLNLVNLTNGQIIGNEISGNRKGIFVSSGTGNTITGNTFARNSQAGYARGSSTGNIVENNLFESNFLAADNSTNDSSFRDNAMSGNRSTIELYWHPALCWGSLGTSGNEIVGDVEDALSFSRGNLDLDVGESANFSFTVNDMRKCPCAACTYSLTLDPPLAITHNRVGDTVTGSFTPTENGYHRLTVTVDDAIGNSYKRTYTYIVGPRDQRTVSYYLRGFEPSNGQPGAEIGGYDSGAMLFAPPISQEIRECSSWVQFSPDALSANAEGYLTHLNVTLSYSIEDQSGPDPYLGFQLVTTFDGNGRDYDAYIPPGDHTDAVVDLPIGGVMDYPFSWYWTTIKVFGAHPMVAMTPANPGIVVFTYEVPMPATP